MLAIGFIATLFARLKPLGMARAMEATAIAQTVVSVIALVIGEDDVVALTAFFALMWLVSAQLFRKAARQEARASGTL